MFTASSRTRTAVILVVMVTAAALVATAALWDRPEVSEPLSSDVPDAAAVDEHRAQIVDVREADLPRQHDPTLPPGARTVELTVEREDGERVVFDTVDETGEMFQPGQRIVVTETADGFHYVTDFQRGPSLLILTGLFVAAVVAMTRWQGVRALAGLAITFAIVLGVVVPSVLAGQNPVAVAVAGGTLVMVVTLYLSHGFTMKSTAAVLGTAAAMAVTALLSMVFIDAASLTGFTSEEARIASMESGGLSLRGLLLAGIIIGALGVLDDVTMSQAATVAALRRAAPDATRARVVAEALSVGRDHIAATINTLFLAYAGASLPLLLLLGAGAGDVAAVVTSEVVAVEVVRTLVGSVGLIAAVPLTTALAAWLLDGLPDEVGNEDDPDQGEADEVADALAPVD